MGYAFISYSSKQYDRMVEIKELLRQKGISTWSAPEDIPIGSKYSEVITQAIKNAGCVLLLLSDSSQNSTYCELEVGLALKCGKVIVPLQIEEIQLNDTFVLYMGDQKIYKAYGRTAGGNDWQQAVEQLRLLCGEQPIPEEPSGLKRSKRRKAFWVKAAGFLWMTVCFPIYARIILFCSPHADFQYGGAELSAVLLSAALIWGLHWLGLVLLVYGHTLNRRRQIAAGDLYRGFSAPQIVLLLSAGLYYLNMIVIMVDFHEYVYLFWGYELELALTMAWVGATAALAAERILRIRYRLVRLVLLGAVAVFLLYGIAALFYDIL